MVALAKQLAGSSEVQPLLLKRFCMSLISSAVGESLVQQTASMILFSAFLKIICSVVAVRPV